MILAAFKEDNPYSLDEYPFNDMYVNDRKFIKVGISSDNIWIGILTGDNSDIINNSSEIESLNKFISFQLGIPVTKSEIISKMYSPDQETKILRDAASGRNIDKFNEYDTFVESIPSV